MKIFEKILWAIAILGYTLKATHIPGGSILLILSLTLMSLFYLLASYFLFRTPDEEIFFDGKAYKKESPFRIVWSILTGISLSTSVIGILFRLMQWPGAQFLLIIGLISLGIISTLFLNKYSQDNSIFFKKAAARIVLVGGLGLLLLLAGTIS